MRGSDTIGLLRAHPTAARSPRAPLRVRLMLAAPNDAPAGQQGLVSRPAGTIPASGTSSRARAASSCRLRRRHRPTRSAGPFRRPLLARGRSPSSVGASPRANTPRSGRQATCDRDEHNRKHQGCHHEHVHLVAIVGTLSPIGGEDPDPIWCLSWTRGSPQPSRSLPRATEAPATPRSVHV